MAHWLMAAVLTLSLGVSRQTLAAASDDNAAAKQKFMSGTKHFDLAEYQEALDDFKQGYRFKDDPVFLYNIAQCYRLLNQNGEALRFYKSYLRRAPNATNRDEVMKKITSLQEALAMQQKASTMPPTHVLPSDGSRPEAATPEAGAAPAPAAASPAPPPTAATSLAATSERPVEKPLYKKWWLWTAVGVVVVGAAVTATVLATQSSSSSGTTFPAIQF